MGRIEDNFELVKEHVAKSQKLFADDDMLPESIQNWFAIMEMCAHLLKDIFNKVKLPSHGAVKEIFSNMYRRKHLKKDYSESFARVAEYRIGAYFGDYARKPQPLPPKASLKRYLDDALKLFKEVKPIVEDYIKTHKKIIEEKTGKK